MWVAVNHNGTPLCPPMKIKALARAEGIEYTYATANPHTVITVEELRASANAFQLARWGF